MADQHYLPTDSGWPIRLPSRGSGRCTYVLSPRGPPGRAAKWQISNGGGSRPLWSRNGHELFYQTDQALDQLMVVNYSVNGDSFVTEKPRVWIEKLPGTDIDLAPDGKR